MAAPVKDIAKLLKLQQGGFPPFLMRRPLLGELGEEGNVDYRHRLSMIVGAVTREAVVADSSSQRFSQTERD